MAGPMYSYDPETSGPGGGPGSMVLSVACAEGRVQECDAWFRCDHPYHRRPERRHVEVRQRSPEQVRERLLASPLPADLAQALADEMDPR